MPKIRIPAYVGDAVHARFYQTDVYGPKKQVLMFPGWCFAKNEGALCLHSAVTKKLIDRRTQILCVEHAPANVKHIADQIELLGLTSRTRFHAGALKDVVLKRVERFDFAQFDLGIIPDRDTVIWMSEVFTNNVVDGADISFGVRYKDDATESFQSCKFAFKTKYKAYAKNLKKAFGIIDKHVLNHALLFFTIFKDFDFETHPELIYQRNGIPMVASKFTELRRRDQARDWPSIHEVLAAGKPLWDEQNARWDEAFELKKEKQRLISLEQNEANKISNPKNAAA